jgi:plasmid maintenance system killer protein
MLHDFSSFKDNKLKAFAKGDHSKVDPNHIELITDILAIMRASSNPEDFRLPGLRYHKYKGTKELIYSVDMSGNDRILFTFQEDSAKYTCIYYGDPHGKKF